MEVSTRTAVPPFNLLTVLDDGTFSPEVRAKRHLDAILAKEREIAADTEALDALAPGVDNDITISAHEINIAAARGVIVREALALAHLVAERDAALLTTAEAAAALGIDVTTVQKMVKAEALPASRIGRDWFIHRDDLAGVVLPRRGRPRLPDDAVKPASLKRRRAR